MQPTEQLWSQIEGIYRAILDHPFLEGLVDGTLPQEAFRYYVLQDAHYLRDYARALSLCAARAPDESATLMFDRHASGAIEVERALHQSFFADFGLSPADVDATPVAPTCRAYTSYLLAACHQGSFAEAVAAVLPCYWIYAEVGRVLLERGSPHPLYHRWIETYGGDEFASVVAEVLAVADRAGAAAGAAERGRMTERFVTTSRYEWMFWDAGWRRERWPV